MSALRAGPGYEINMDYCKFENTAKALEQCMHALSENGIQHELENASQREKPYIMALLAKAQELAEEYANLLEEEGY